MGLVLGSRWEHSAGMSSSTKLLVNFRILGLSSLLITILNISYERARRYSHELPMKCSTYICIQCINEILNCSGARLAFSRTHEKARQLKAFVLDQSATLLVAQVFGKRLDGRVWCSILIRVRQRGLLTLESARICVCK